MCQKEKPLTVSNSCDNVAIMIAYSITSSFSGSNVEITQVGKTNSQPCLDVATLRAYVPIAVDQQLFRFLSKNGQDVLWWKHSHQTA